MNINELETPALLLRGAALERNLKTYQAACDKNGKRLWPMIKTHKSTTLAKRQAELGADGFLCGTLDECEALCRQGIQRIMYAYPVAGEVSCHRAVTLAKQCEFYVRLDGTDAAKLLNDAAEQEGIVIPYTLLIDCGLQRFGVAPEAAAALAEEMKQFSHLRFCGISTHPGHVYGEADPAKIAKYAEDERNALRKAADALCASGFEVKLVTSGATPTFSYALEDDLIQVYHPGNYIFNDCIQIANGTAAEEDCALVIYSTVIAHPRTGLYLCDAGAKCLGLDKGAHGNASVKGSGRVLCHPEITVGDLSEEVGKLLIEGETELKVGDRIMIIPNHACSSANLFSYYQVVDEDGTVKERVEVDIRGNLTAKDAHAPI